MGEWMLLQTAMHSFHMLVIGVYLTLYPAKKAWLVGLTVSGLDCYTIDCGFNSYLDHMFFFRVCILEVCSRNISVCLFSVLY